MRGNCRISAKFQTLFSNSLSLYLSLSHPRGKSSLFVREPVSYAKPIVVYLKRRIKFPCNSKDIRLDRVHDL